MLSIKQPCSLSTYTLYSVNIKHFLTSCFPASFSFFVVSSCITTYKKTPPPVPPRTSTCSTASKPYISITAQSSTESAQVLHTDSALLSLPNVVIKHHNICEIM